MRRKPTPSPYELPTQTAATIINAAALQDHLMRSMALQQPTRRVALANPKPSDRPTKSALKLSFQRELQLSSQAPKAVAPVGIERGRSPFVVASTNAYRHVWVCESCTCENEDRKSSVVSSNHDERCAACDTLRPTKARRAPITLAQQRGLVPAPPPKLSRDDWERCESQAVERGDASHPCSICREPFGVQEQVILSCSHMFHLACMQSFERFLRTSQRVCPLCRKENYQKRMTSKAAGIHRVRCAVQIQAMWRGHLTRKRAEPLWHDFYRRGKGDPKRRRQFLANRVGKTADRLVSAMRARDDSIDSLLAEFDRTLSLSKQVFSDTQPQTEDDSTCKSCPATDWPKIFLKAQARADRECPICIQPFSSSMGDAALLTCSHVFHRECLRAFEDFNIYEVPLCPLCRAAYQSRAWMDAKKYM